MDLDLDLDIENWISVDGCLSDIEVGETHRDSLQAIAHYNSTLQHTTQYLHVPNPDPNFRLCTVFQTVVCSVGYT